MPEIALVGEAWGEEEARLAHPFVGAAGRELAQELREAGYFEALPRPFWRPEDVRDFWLTQSRVSLHNVFNLRPDRNDIDTLCTSKSDDRTGLPPIRTGKYVRAEYLPELQRLGNELKAAEPNIVLALGNVPAWALLKSGSISKIRGAITTESLTGRGFKCLPTFHPAGILRQWENRAVTIMDLRKGLRESSYAEVRRPDRAIHIPETLADLEDFHDEFIRDCRLLSFDIETSGDQITCIGFSPNRSCALVIPFVDPRREGGSFWGSLKEEIGAWNYIRRVLTGPIPKLAQNGLYDVQFLWRFYGIPTMNFEHDTMLLHHALQPESKKGLGFLGSVYTNEASWKIMRTDTLKRDE